MLNINYTKERIRINFMHFIALRLTRIYVTWFAILFRICVIFDVVVWSVDHIWVWILLLNHCAYCNP